MLHSVNQNDVGLIEDLVDDPIVSASSRIEALQFADQWLPEAMWALGDRAEDRLERGVSYLVGEPVEVAETLGRDLDFVHGGVLNVVAQAQAFDL